MLSMGIFTVATNKYIDYWQEMVTTFDEQIGETWECTFYVFTDDPRKAEEFQKSLKNRSEVVAIEIDNLGWPDATLLRFELIDSIVQECTQEVLMHLDADMIVHSNFDDQFSPASWESGIFLVAHPGFYREYKRQNSMQNIFSKALANLRKGARSHFPIYPLGSWEDSEKSAAYVQPAARKVYVCGATWGGTRLKFEKMVSSLAKQTRLDRQNGVIAVWHDESHLNRWASSNTFQLLNPNYCYAEPFSDNQGLQKIIQAVDKGENSTRA